MKLCFLDIETTGLDHKKNRIWQIAGVIRINGKIKERFNIENKKYESDVYHNFVSGVLRNNVNRFDKNDKMFFIAYNSRFDENFIRSMFDRNNNKFYGSYFYNPSIDVMQMGATYFLKRPKIKRPDNFKLMTLSEYFGIKVKEDKLHDASYDAEITRALYNKLIKK